MTRHLQAQHLWTHSCQASLGLQVHLLSLPTGWLPCMLQCNSHLALHAAKQMMSCMCCHSVAKSMVQLAMHDCCTRITVSCSLPPFQLLCPLAPHAKIQKDVQAQASDMPDGMQTALTIHRHKASYLSRCLAGLMNMFLLLTAVRDWQACPCCCSSMPSASISLLDT